MDWNKNAGKYEQTVYSITKEPKKRDRILNYLKDNSNILILGCGRETYLQEDIIKLFPNSKITLSDYYDKMLTVSKENFNHPNLSFVKEDMMKLDYESEFDFIISTNSILMPTISGNNTVFESCHKALKNNGKLIAYLPSYESCLNLANKQDNITELFNMQDSEQKIGDSVDGTVQSFHTKFSIDLALYLFREFSIEDISCSESPKEFQHFKDLYGSILSDELINEVFEHFIVATK